MMNELNLFKEFATCSIDESRDEKIRMAETTPFCLMPAVITVVSWRYSQLVGRRSRSTSSCGSAGRRQRRRGHGRGRLQRQPSAATVATVATTTATADAATIATSTYDRVRTCASPELPAVTPAATNNTLSDLPTVGPNVTRPACRTTVPVRLCIRSFCTQWQIPAEVDWLSGLGPTFCQEQ